MSIVEKLANKIIPVSYRSIIRLTGKDVRRLMQGISSNDFVHNKTTTFFSTFLNPQGKLFSDSLVTIAEDNSILLDVPSAYVPNVMKLLQMSVLRLDVKLLWEKDSTVCATLSTDNKPPKAEAILDPRFKAFQVYRTVSSERIDNQSLTPLWKCFELLNGVWSTEDGLKNRHGGCVNLDLLNGASRTKGCYVGQENYTRYVNTYKQPNRVVPLLLSHSALPNSYSVKEACQDLKADSILQDVHLSSSQALPVTQDGTEIGEVVFLQPHSSVALAMINGFDGVKGRWKVNGFT
ncbi:hypothetical protein WA577_004251, partial [Blastocystis sp. JDR]